MHLQRLAERCRSGGILPRFSQRAHGLRDVLVDQQLRVFRGRVSEDEDRHTDTALAQLHRLVETAYREIIRSRVLQQPRDRQRAVTVGVGLDNAEKSAACRQRSADGLVIVPDVCQADLRPGSLLQIVHIVNSNR